MTPERWQLIESLYSAAQQLPPSDRAKFLETACAGDDSLRRRIERMLVEDESDDKALDRPANEFLRTSQLNPGTLLGPYRIEGIIGAGGMGQVYKARDTRLDRPVAVKVVKKQFSARFDREARVIAGLSHPNICTLYDVGPNFLVMEFIEGKPLQGPLPLATALEYATQILDALETAHLNSVVHRDLKPGNILVGKQGIKLLDFGLAKQQHSELDSNDETEPLSLTQAGAIMGTPAYMAPEQWAGKPADARTDIYAFGCIVHEMLTGQRVKAGQPVKVGSPSLEKVIVRCLAENPADRWQSAAEIKPHLKLRHLSRYAVAAVLALVATAGVFFYRFSGPPATVAAREPVVLAGFVNSTGDPAFDHSLQDALAADVLQSSALSILPEQRVKEMLAFMQAPADTRITEEVAQSICLRTRSRIYLAGSLANIGNQYTIRLKAASCESGAALAHEVESINGKEAVLTALHKAVGRVRGKLEESIPTLKPLEVPLEEATTPSLEALKSYSLGRRFFTTEPAKAEPLFKHALQQDPNFAMAQLSLGLSYLNLNELERGAQETRIAFGMTNNISDWERYAIESRYYFSVTGDLEKARRVYESWLTTYPTRNQGANLVNLDLLLGDLDRAQNDTRTMLRRLTAKQKSAPCQAKSVYIARNSPREAKELVSIPPPTPCDERAQFALAAITNDTKSLDDAAARNDETRLDFDAATGRLASANELVERALSQVNRGLERPSLLLGIAAFSDALHGNVREAKGLADQLEQFAQTRDTRSLTALVQALSGNTTAAIRIANELEKKFPEDTLVRVNYLPSIRGLIAISQGHAADAIQVLAKSKPYELGLMDNVPSCMPIYVRALALLALDRGPEARDEFLKLTARQGLLYLSRGGPLMFAMAYVGLARAYAHQHDSAHAREAYQHFLTLWKDADPSIPVLKEVQQELSQLK